MRKASTLCMVLVTSAALATSACGSDGGSGAPPASGASGGSGGSPEQTGTACAVAADCYPDVAPGALAGDAMCLDRVRGGYCTHLCQADADCCAASGECLTEFAQVCSPFESTGTNMCFLSCEDADLRPDGGTVSMDANEYCQREANAAFMCRSSGGGSSNRKICVPGDCGVGASCATTADCTSGLTCISSVLGGYCGIEDCIADADCPNNSACVHHDDGRNYCFRRCNQDSDCSFCRAWDVRASCTSDVTFAQTTTTGTVCVPGAI